MARNLPIQNRFVEGHQGWHCTTNQISCMSAMHFSDLEFWVLEEDWQLDIALSVMDSTGRLLKYDAKTKEVTVLLRNLSLAAGVAVDEEEKFVMVTDFTANQTRKITLQGGRSIIETIQPTRDNIKRARLNKFWLAAARVDPRIDSGLLPTGVRINGNGTVLETVNLERWYGNKSVFEVQEFGTKLYIV
ncbi:protein STRICTOSIDINE SYNTHASE-LIKE 12-like [Gossypium raimondii]|uniref:protein STRICTOSIDINE SYNTHASE-LIKE 12-like n=1 Tax=Gossypium raimondii TaxID=29730 RepID=UPI00227C3672|nr:protein STRICTOSIDINE SYNTHASE-LIKE 12-like [Gossypium raimondii]